jgi:hypothetical protein
MVIEEEEEEDEEEEEKKEGEREEKKAKPLSEWVPAPRALPSRAWGPLEAFPLNALLPPVTLS